MISVDHVFSSLNRQPTHLTAFAYCREGILSVWLPLHDNITIADWWLRRDGAFSAVEGQSLQ
jgi:hypothetical protein